MIPDTYKTACSVFPRNAVNDNWLNEDDAEERFSEIQSETKPTP